MYDSEIPWVIESKDRGNNHLRMLRLAARLERGTQGQLGGRKLEEFESWKRKLKRWDAVVAYGWHRNREGERIHGFYLTARRPGVDEGLIREPDAG